MKRIYFDESGFTGYNLLDPNQPIFVIASSSINPEVAAELLKKSLPNYKGEEFKFSNILNSTNQAGLGVLASYLTPLIDQVFLYVVDKKFAVFAKMIDFLVEPAITQAGYDFYADGFCRKYTNYIYFGINHIDKQGLYPHLIASYLEFSRNPTEPAIKKLASDLRSVKEKVTPEIKPFIDEMILGAENLTNNFDLSTFRDTNDIHLTTMLAIVGYWRQHFSEDFSIVHDASSHFLRQRATWEAITNNTVASQIHPLGDGTTVEFPLRVTETIAVDSKDNYSIQLCDLLAGFTSFIFKEKDKDGKKHPLLKIADESGFVNLMSNSIRPGYEFPKHPPQKLKGPDAVDLMTKIIKDGTRSTE